MPGGNLLEEISGGVPRAPHAPAPPSAEDVLGPPPHAPHAPTLGSRGGRLRLPSPSRSIGRAAPAQHEQLRPPPAPPAPTPRPGAAALQRDIASPPEAEGEPRYNAPRGMGRKPSRQRAADIAQRFRRPSDQTDQAVAEPGSQQSRAARAAEAMRRHAERQRAAGDTDAQAEAEAAMFANDPTFQAHLNPPAGETGETGEATP